MTTAATISSKLTLDVSEYDEGIKKAVEGTQQMTEVAGESTEQFKLYSDMIKTVNQAGGDYADKYAEIMNLHQSGEKTWEETGKLVGELKEEFDVTGGSIGIFAEQEEEATKKTLNFSKGLGQLAKGLLGMATIYAVGRAAMKFGSDALKMAETAGKLGKEFDANAKASDRLKLAIGVQLGRALQSTTGLLAEFKNEMAENIEKGNEMAEMFELLGYTSGDIANYYGQIRTGVVDATEAYAGLIEQVEALGIAEESEMEIAMRAAKVAAERGAALNAMGEAMGALEDQVEDVANAFEGVETGITGMIESALQLVEWERAGGAEFADSFKEFWDAVVSEAITDETIIDAALQMFAAASLGLEQEVGEINWYEAAKRYQDQFGGTIQAANEEIIFNWAAMQVYLNQIDLNTAAQNIHDQLGIPIEEARKQLFALANKLRAIDGMVSETTVIITTYDVTGTGAPPGGGGTRGRAGERKARQLGGRFFAGQTMLVGEAGTEIITAEVGGQVIPNDALDMSEVVEKLDELEMAVLNMGEDILAGFSMAVG